jgi:hypothetical protein
MGIKDKLNKLATKEPFITLSPNGSIYAPNYIVDGAYPTSSLAGEDSPLHASKNGTAGYSLNIDRLAEVTKLYNEYDDGVSNTLPKPTEYNTFPDPTGKFTPKYTPSYKYGENPPEKTTPNPAP